MKQKIREILSKYRQNQGYTMEHAERELLNLFNVSNRFIAITYMIYIILWEALVVGGCGYVVFGLNRSGWWMLLAVLLSGAAYTPKKWKQLFI